MCTRRAFDLVYTDLVPYFGSNVGTLRKSNHPPILPLYDSPVLSRDAERRCGLVAAVDLQCLISAVSHAVKEKMMHEGTFTFGR